MAMTPELFAERLAGLREELAEQGRRVRRLAQAAFDAFMQHDADGAREAMAQDDEIDAFDVGLEKRAVALLSEAAAEAVPLEENLIRGSLTLVKVNNELERIADCGVLIAERTVAMPGGLAAAGVLPPTTRVMTNSVVGLLRDIAVAYGQRDEKLARAVLQSDDVVAAFKMEILRQAAAEVSAGRMAVTLAFELHELANQSTIMADHATNIAEQVIYDATGTIVRHREGKWVIGDRPRVSG